jgi:hypothetical protein
MTVAERLSPQRHYPSTGERDPVCGMTIDPARANLTSPIRPVEKI